MTCPKCGGTKVAKFGSVLSYASTLPTVTVLGTQLLDRRLVPFGTLKMTSICTVLCFAGVLHAEAHPVFGEIAMMMAIIVLLVAGDALVRGGHWLAAGFLIFPILLSALAAIWSLQTGMWDRINAMVAGLPVVICLSLTAIGWIDEVMDRRRRARLARLWCADCDLLFSDSTPK